MVIVDDVLKVGCGFEMPWPGRHAFFGVSGNANASFMICGRDFECGEGCHVLFAFCI